jgi:hypothetical protein
MLAKGEQLPAVTSLGCIKDAFVEGMWSIFNETPIRQGKRFWHYGKDVPTLKKGIQPFLVSRNDPKLATFVKSVCREQLLGA